MQPTATTDATVSAAAELLHRMIKLTELIMVALCNRADHNIFIL